MLHAIFKKIGAVRESTMTCLSLKGPWNIVILLFLISCVTQIVLCQNYCFL